MLRAARPFGGGVILVAVLVGLDVYTKALALHRLPQGLLVPFLPGWDWQVAFNRGAAFSLLSDHPAGQSILLGISLLAVFILAGWFVVTCFRSRLLSLCCQLGHLFGILMLLSGALGNLIDRVRWGAVVDFIAWHYGPHYWPTFNLADAWICIGAGVLAFTRSES